LFKEYPKEKIPSVVTVHNILKRNGLVCPQKRMRRVKPVFPIFDPKYCNEVWSADYKGKFLIGNKIYCHPLTIVDSKSRYVFTAKGHYKENLKSAKDEFKRVFRTYGIPKQIHTDNGSPFGFVRAIQRYTQLSYWFIELGISPVFSDPDHPEQNGRHEHMHRDLKAALKGKYVGIQEQGNGIWKVFYRNVFLGFFNENELRNKQKSIRL
jgi:transposase InsO family protein